LTDILSLDNTCHRIQLRGSFELSSHPTFLLLFRFILTFVCVHNIDYPCVCSETFSVDESVMVLPRALATAAASMSSVPITLCFLDNDTNELLEMVFGQLPPSIFRVNRYGYTVLGYLPVSCAMRFGDWTLQLVAARNCVRRVATPPVAELVEKRFTGTHSVANLRPVVCRLLRVVFSIAMLCCLIMSRVQCAIGFARVLCYAMLDAPF
jgi:hypothetical protein